MSGKAQGHAGAMKPWTCAASHRRRARPFVGFHGCWHRLGLRASQSSVAVSSSAMRKRRHGVRPAHCSTPWPGSCPWAICPPSWGSSCLPLPQQLWLQLRCCCCPRVHATALQSATEQLTSNGCRTCCCAWRWVAVSRLSQRRLTPTHTCQNAQFLDSRSQVLLHKWPTRTHSWQSKSR